MLEVWLKVLHIRLAGRRFEEGKAVVRAAQVVAVLVERVVVGSSAAVVLRYIVLHADGAVTMMMVGYGGSSHHSYAREQEKGEYVLSSFHGETITDANIGGFGFICKRKRCNLVANEANSGKGWFTAPVQGASTCRNSQ